MALRSYKYRLRPNRAQAVVLDAMLRDRSNLPWIARLDVAAGQAVSYSVRPAPGWHSGGRL